MNWDGEECREDVRADFLCTFRVLLSSTSTEAKFKAKLRAGVELAENEP